MTRLAKLYDRVRANPHGVSFREFERLIEAFGFELARTKGSHRQYVHPQVPRPLPIQPEGGTAKRYQVRQFLEMVDQYGLHMAE